MQNNRLYCHGLHRLLTWVHFSSLPVHSGDTDAVVPVTATRYSIDALKLPTLVNWYPWYDHGKVSTRTVRSNKILQHNENFNLILIPIFFPMSQVGGWSQVYKGLTLITIAGAGHEVPLHRPRQALIMFRHFLQNKPMPAQ
jgi:serine carboxypeptidase-like clade II